MPSWSCWRSELNPDGIDSSDKLGSAGRETVTSPEARRLTQMGIVLVVFPVVAMVLNTPFYVFALVADKWLPGWSVFVFLPVSLLIDCAGAFYVCRLLWPKRE